MLFLLRDVLVISYVVPSIFFVFSLLLFALYSLFLQKYSGLFVQLLFYIYICAVM